MNAWNLKAEQPWMVFLADVPPEVKDSDEVAYSVLRVCRKEMGDRIPKLDPHETALPPFDDNGIMITYGANAFSAALVKVYPLDPEDP